MSDRDFLAASADMTLTVTMATMLPASLCVVVATVACIAYRNQRRKKALVVEGGRIKKIFIYPIKSVPPLEVDSAELEIEGLTYKNVRDRYKTIDYISRRLSHMSLENDEKIPSFISYRFQESIPTEAVRIR